MSSLLKEDMEKKLFKPKGQTLYEFIETKSKSKERFYLCASVAKGQEVLISLVKHYRACLDERYEVVEMWFLKELKFIDGKEPDTDNPHFDMMFEEVCNVEAYSCASKYAFARSLIKLNTLHTKRDIKVLNFDSSYIEDGVIWSSNNGDCLFYGYFDAGSFNRFTYTVLELGQSMKVPCMGLSIPGCEQDYIW